MSDEKKVTGRRGAGRGRRQTQQEPTVPGQEPSTPGGDAENRGRGRGSDNGSPVEGSIESGSPKGSPTGSDVEEKMKNVKIQDLAGRPGFGAVGQKVAVLANHHEIRVTKELTVLQYHVDILHEKLKLNRDEKRKIFWQCIEENLNVFKNRYRLAFDGEHILITLDRLNFGKNEAQGHFEVNIRLQRMERPEIMKVNFQATGLIHIDFRQARAAGMTADRYTTPLQIIDLLFRQHRSCPLETDMAAKWYQFASTGYKIPPDGEGQSLSGGRVIWQGLFGAARVGQNYTPFINFDVSHSGFYKPQSVLEFLVDILNTHFANPRDRNSQFHVSQLNARTELSELWQKTVHNAIRGLKIWMEVHKANGTNIMREFTVNRLVDVTAETHIFEQRNPDGQMNNVSVAEYFATRYGQLQYPKLNLLHVGPRNKKTYVPMEHCYVAPNQRVKKLASSETATMIKAAAINAPNRKEKILDLVKESGYGDDPWLKEFGIRVNPAMKQVEARQLTAPRILFGNGGRPVDVRDGVWDMRNQRFFLPASCKKIGALILDTRDMAGYMGFFEFLLKTCIGYGMDVPQSISQAAIRTVDPSGNVGLIEPALTSLKEMGVELVIVTLPQKTSTHYSEVKRVAEIILGMMTQCVVKANIMKCMEKRDAMTTGNIAQKINMKLGGVNSKADADEMARKVLLDQPTLVLGIDVTHPSPTEKKMPSVSAVVGNVDDSFMRYAAAVRVQKHRRESIVAGHLDDLVRKRLVEYHKFVGDENIILQSQGKKPKGTRPDRIIIFRDGVAEGQFQEVLREELGGIREACKSLEASYKPKLTLIVAQKRHHTRFFPGPGNQGCGRAMNIRPGTVVDKEITHPEQFEFYLCSHFGIQGTSRPIRYHVLHDDSHFSADHIQVMTYYLCHVYARCTRTVSIPAPVYYADLACRRARAHIYDKVSDFGSDTMSQRSGSGNETETAISEDELVRSSTVDRNLEMRMYFV